MSPDEHMGKKIFCKKHAQERFEYKTRSEKVLQNVCDKLSKPKECF